jgi:beta-lactam-binding protein with PASTA domain
MKEPEEIVRDNESKLLTKEMLEQKASNERKDKLDEIVEEVSAKDAPKINIATEKKSDKKVFIAIGCVVATLAVLLFVGVMISINRSEENVAETKTTNKIIDVRNIVGYSEDEARNILEGIGLELVINDYQYSDKYLEGQIISQIPESGAIKEGEKIKVVVSQGPKTAVVPNVLEEKEKSAVKSLKKLGFKVKIKRVYDDAVKKGRVVAINCQEGETIAIGSQLILTVSKGQKKENIASSSESVGTYSGQYNYSTVGDNNSQSNVNDIKALGTYSEKNVISNKKINLIRSDVMSVCGSKTDNTKNNLAKYMSANKLTDATATYSSLTNDTSKSFSCNKIEVHIDNDSEEEILVASEKAVKSISRISGSYGLGISSFMENQGYNIYIIIIY